jgi:hypothetical protein
MAKQAVAVKEDTVVANAVPDFMKGDAGMGRESIDRSMLTTPRISLMHPTSGPVVDGLVSSGHWWHNLLQQDLGSEIIVTPIFIEKGYTLWNPDRNEGGVLARGVQRNGIWVWEPSHTKFNVVTDPKHKTTAVWDTKGSIKESGLADWGKGDAPPVAKESTNILFAVHGAGPEVFGIVSFSKKAFPIGRKLVQAIHAKAGVPLFGLKYSLSSTTATSKSGDRHLVPKWVPAGMVDDPAFYNACKAMYENVKDVGLGMAANDEDHGSVGDETTSGGSAVPF